MKCPGCNGSGKWAQWKDGRYKDIPCPQCKGSGQVPTGT
jgi:DnaJ-class molecular chaperone